MTSRGPCLIKKDSDGSLENSFQLIYSAAPGCHTLKTWMLWSGTRTKSIFPPTSFDILVFTVFTNKQTNDISLVNLSRHS